MSNGRDMRVQQPSITDSALSRRRFLQWAAATAGAAPLVCRAPKPTRAGVPETKRTERPMVVQVRSPEVVTPLGIHGEVLGDLLQILLTHVTGKPNATEAWRSVLSADDVIGIKFDRTAADSLGTSDPMFRAILGSLQAAGFKSKQVVAIEVPPALSKETGVTEPDWGWSSGEYDFGSGHDRLAAWLDQVTAIINVPFLKTHNITGLTCCLMNISHAVIKHPAQYFGADGTPYIGDIVALPVVRQKLRLHIVNALRVVFNGGPEAVEDFIWDQGILFGGFDPVAIDTVALQLIDDLRVRLHLAAIANQDATLPYLVAAAERGLGSARLYEIEVDKFKL